MPHSITQQLKNSRTVGGISNFEFRISNFPSCRLPAAGCQLLLLSLALVLGAYSAATAAQIALVVSGPAGAARSGWPVAAGVPFPQGALRSGDGVRLLSGRGEEMPLQARPTTWWPDGSVRSLLVDALVELPAGGQVPLVLEYGAGLKATLRSQGLQVTETSDAILLDTGVAQVKVRRRGFPLVTIARSGKDGVWIDDLVVVDQSRKQSDLFTGRAGLLSRVSVEERGPIRGTVAVRGTHGGPNGSPIPYHLRIEAYAGQSWIRVEHFLANPGGRLGAREVSIRLGTRLTGEVPYRMGGGGTSEHSGTLGPGIGAALWHIGSSRGLTHEVHKDGQDAKRVAAGRGAPGWAIFGVGDEAAVLAIEEPDGLYAAGRGLLLAGDRRAAIVLASPGSKVPFGMTSRVVIGAGELPAPAGLTERAYAVAPAAWYAASGVLGPLLPIEDGRILPGYAATVQKMIHGGWGRRDFGSYYDVALSWFNIFAMTGDARALRLGRMAATNHWDYDMQHVGPQRGIRSIDDPRHIYTAGPLASYVLTGDRLALDMAREVADGIVDHLPDWEGYIQGFNERSGAWPLLSLVAAYEATLDERYLRGARWVVDRVLAWQHPTRGGWIRTYEDPEECPYGDQGGSPFMTSLLMEALLKYYRISGDDRVPGSLSRAADWLIRETWLPSIGRPGVDTFLYIQCRPAGSQKAGYGETWDLNPMIAAGLAAAYRVAGNPRHLEVAIQAFRVGIARHLPPAAGKQFAQFFRSSGLAMAQIATPDARDVVARGAPAKSPAGEKPGVGKVDGSAQSERVVGPWVRVGGMLSSGVARRPPIMDGRPEAEEWSAAATATRFALAGGEGVANEQTVLRVMADAQALYLGFEMTQARPPRPPAPSANRRLWTEDSLEIFLAPDPSSGRYFQLIAAADGARYQSAGKTPGWQAEWEAVPGRQAAGWSLEIRIPFAALGARPEGTWGFNVCRNQAGDGEKSCWVAPLGPYHNSHRFGRLLFGERGFSVEQDAVRNAGDGARSVSVAVRSPNAGGGASVARTTQMVVPSRGSAALPAVQDSASVSELEISARDSGGGKTLASEVRRRRMDRSFELAVVPARYVSAGQIVEARVWVRAGGETEVSAVLGTPRERGRPIARWKGQGPTVLDLSFTVPADVPDRGSLSVELVGRRAAGTPITLVRHLMAVEGF